MELYELDLKQILEVKLLRLNKPKFSNLSSLSGNYNSLEDLSTISNLPQDKFLENKIKEFCITDEYSPSPENMLTFNQSFGYIFKLKL